MKRDESVFFFTLVDFLLTALFFGLVVFAVGRARIKHDADEQKVAAAAVDSIRRATGVSDLTELTDRLTRLGPLAKAEVVAQLVAHAGGADEARKSLEMVAESGGRDSVMARLERLQRREGAGKPHCLYRETGDGREAIALATAVGTDSTITFERETPQLQAVLASIGREFSDVRMLRLRDFRRTFGRLVEVQPSCLYTIEFIERTRYVDARDAARGLFYMRIRHE